MATTRKGRWLVARRDTGATVAPSGIITAGLVAASTANVIFECDA